MKFKRFECLGNGRTGLGMEFFNEKWQLNQKGKNDKINVPIPGNVRLALLNENKITDPFIAKNNKDSQWVSLVEWEYHNNLTLDKWKNKISQTFEEGGLLHLCFDAIDYDASFIIDKKAISNQRGMFTPVDIIMGISKKQVDIKSSLPIEVDFHIQPFWRQHAVKCQMAFGWDFAPEIRTVGIWKNIRLYYTGSAFFKNAYIIARPINHKNNDSNSNSNLRLRGNITIVNPKSLDLIQTTAQFELKIILPDTEKIIPIEILSGEEFEIDLGNYNIQQWMPWSLGTPHQVPITIQLFSDGELFDEFRGKVINRNVKWLRNPGTIKGHENWTLSVNDKKMFLRGINWVPPDSIYGRITKDRYKKLIDMALDMNIDIIRVWGGGIEEKQEFYDYCDEVGMMVWQEFPFACTNYPDFPEYMEIVKKECNGIVERTRCHPCVVTYCGGNEFNPYINSHIINAVRGAVSKYAPDRFCFAVSPYQGDDHNWRFWGARRMFDAFEVNGVGPFQMLTEYGMQAAPNIDTLKECIGDNNSTKLKDIEQFIDYHKGDVSGHRTYSEKFGTSVDDISSFILNSQKLQAYALKYAIEVCRSAWPNVSGVMPWQLSDPWPNISWSVVDYNCKPKLSYNMLKISYAPILPMIRKWRIKKGDKTIRVGDIIVHNSTQEDFAGKLQVEILRNKKQESLKTLNLTVPVNKSLKIGEVETQSMHGTLIRLKLYDQGGNWLISNFNFPAMEPIPKKTQLIRDVIDARFDGWWRKHMTYLMDLDKVREERPNWVKRRKEFYKYIKNLSN